MRNRPIPWRIGVAVASTCLLVAACSDNSSDDPDSVSLEPLSKVEAPAISTPPSGSVSPSPSGLHSTTFDSATRTIVALEDDSTSLLIFDIDHTEQAPSVVALPSAAADVVTVGDGTLLLPMNGMLARADIRSSAVETTEVDANLLSAASLTDGRVAAGDDSGVIHIFGSDSNEAETVDGLSSVDSLAATQYGLTALDRRETSLTQINLDAKSLGAALRAGEGAAETATDRFGRILVTDAVGRELLVYSSEDLLLRQRFPVDAQPWAVAYDDKSDIAWISTPGTNEVVGYTLETGIPVEVKRFPTVRQPDSIAVDSNSGDLFVGSATGAGLQRIPVRGAD